jgi:hypothetical protein
MLMPASAQCETWIAEAAAIESWAKAAKPGDLFIYARATGMPRGSAGGATARMLEAQGHLRLHLRSLGGGYYEYRAYRRAASRPAVSRPVSRIEPRLDGDMARLMRVLRFCARQGMPCPTNQQLAKRVGCADRERVKYALRRLRDLGKISWEVVDPATKARVVTICDTGIRTAAPAGAIA